MEHSSSTSSLRKQSVNTLLKHTLQLSNLTRAPSTALIPESKIILKPIGDTAENGDDSGPGGTARGRRHGGATTRRSTARDPITGTATATGGTSSGGPLATCRSMRNMIEEIELRAREGQLSPRYVTDIRSLSPEKFSWTKKSPSPRRHRSRTRNRSRSRSRSLSPDEHTARGTSRERGRQVTARGATGRRGEDDAIVAAAPHRPQMNMMGCHQNVELILSKADERIRKQLMARQIRDVAQQEQRDRIEAMIHATHNRAEIRAHQLKVETEQKFLMKIIQMAIYIKQLKVIYAEDLNRNKVFTRISTARRRISMVCVSWRKRKNAMRYLQIMKNLMRNHSFFMLHLRIIYKRQCVKRILTFFDEIVNCKKVHTNLRIFYLCFNCFIKTISLILSYLIVTECC